MAEKTRYPQIPRPVLSGVRAILKRTPNVTIDDRFLSVQLGVQEIAARGYLAELRSIGLLTDEGKPTPLAHKWRIDDTYSEAVQQILVSVYPEGLLNVAPPVDGERKKVVKWFLQEGLGQGAAGNKAATYLLIGSTTPEELQGRGNGVASSKTNVAPKSKPLQSSKPKKQTGAMTKQSEHLHETNLHGSSPAPIAGVDNFDQIPIRLPKGRKAILVIPSPFYETDKNILKSYIDIIHVEEAVKEDPSG